MTRARRFGALRRCASLPPGSPLNEATNDHRGPSSAAFIVRLAMIVACLTGVMVTPVLGGGPVYDDALMVRNPAMASVGELRHVFTRTSVDYLREGGADPNASQGATYRPVTMATLIATTAFGRGMLPHHVVSACLHALAAVLLGFALRRRGAPEWLATGLAAVFASHPVLAEAWIWVNGRSDLVAGVLLAWLALILARPKGAVWALHVALVVAFGSLAKEPFVVAAGALLLADALRRSRSDRTWLAAGGASGIALAVVARTAVVGTAARPASDVASWLARTPRLLALAGESLAVPAARPMRLLAYELSRPASVVGVVALLALGVFVAFELRARRFEGPLLLAGAAACMVPTAHVADLFWLGFDRYLYMPAILVLLALAGLLANLPERHAPRARMLVGIVAVASALATTLTATYYVSDRALGTAMVDDRPDDPTGMLYLAGDLLAQGRRDAAAQAIDLAPVSRVPAIEHQRASRWLDLQRQDRARAVILAALADNPRDPFLASDALGLAVAEQRFDDVVALSRVARTREGARQSACDAVRAGAPSAPAVREARRILGCVAARR